jgi:hypothetical protein
MPALHQLALHEPPPRKPQSMAIIDCQDIALAFGSLVFNEAATQEPNLGFIAMII